MIMATRTVVPVPLWTCDDWITDSDGGHALGTSPAPAFVCRTCLGSRGGQHFGVVILGLERFQHTERVSVVWLTTRIEVPF